jgi:hypothetical protein
VNDNVFFGALVSDELLRDDRVAAVTGQLVSSQHATLSLSHLLFGISSMRAVSNEIRPILFCVQSDVVFIMMFFRQYLSPLASGSPYCCVQPWRC